MIFLEWKESPGNSPGKKKKKPPMKQPAPRREGRPGQASRNASRPAGYAGESSPPRRQPTGGQRPRTPAGTTGQAPRDTSRPTSGLGREGTPYQTGRPSGSQGSRSPSGLAGQRGDRLARRPAPATGRGAADKPSRPPAGDSRGRGQPRPADSRQAAGKGKRPPGRRLRPGFFIGLALVVVTVLVVLSLTVLFPVKSIEVEGGTRYTPEEIVEVSALVTGENLLLTDTDTAAARILKQLPYIGEAEISRRLPGTLVVRVAEADPVCALETDGQYLLLNEKNKVVDTSVQKQPGLLLIRGMGIGEWETGTDIAFQDAAQASLLEDLLTRLENAALPVTLVDMSDTVSLRFVLDNRILVEFGSSAGLDKKLAHLSATYADIAAEETGALDLSWWTESKKEAYFRDGALEEQWLVPTEPLPAEEGADGDGQASQPADSAVPSDASSAADEETSAASDGGESDVSSVE